MQDLHHAHIIGDAFLVVLGCGRETRRNLVFLLPEVQWRPPWRSSIRHELDGGGWFNVNFRGVAWPLVSQSTLHHYHPNIEDVFLSQRDDLMTIE